MGSLLHTLTYSSSSRLALMRPRRVPAMGRSLWKQPQGVRRVVLRSSFSTGMPASFVVGGEHISPSREDRNNNNNKSTTMMLASSVVVVKDSIAQRVMDWLVRVWNKCRDLVWVTLRGTELVLFLSPLVVLTPASILSDKMLTHNYVSDLTWWYFCQSMRNLGPAFVKLCQWVATRRDIFPPHVCDRLAHLHDRGYPHSWKHTDAMLKEAFGDYEAKGLKVDRATIGCGSAAQVHSGKLVTKNGNGTLEERPIAIKVLHPRFEKLVNRDLWFMQAIASLLDSMPSQTIKMLNLPRATENFGNVLRRQADLRIEGENLKQFRSNFYGKDEQAADDCAIVFPCPMEGWVSENVLVEEYVRDAVSIAEYLHDSTTDGLEVRKELAGPLLRAFLKMVFLDNFTHCDLHPGNVLVRTTVVPKKNENAGFWGKLNTANAEPTEDEVKRTIVFLDAGIATALGDRERKNLRDLFRAVILNEGYEAGRLMVERAPSPVMGDGEDFAKGIEELVSEFHDRRKDGLTLGAVRIGSLLSRVLDLCRIHGVEVDPQMASIVISTLVLEGLGRSLEPSLNLIDFAVPFVIGRGRV